MIKIAFIDGVRIPVDVLEVTEIKGEELNFGVLRIPFSTKKENYQILSEIKLFANDNVTLKEYDKMILLSDKVTRISKVDEIYEHTITFIESVKQYEKQLSASISISQPLSGNKLSLLDAINKVRDKVPFERLSLHGSTRLFTIDPTQSTLLDSIEAPQFFFNKQEIRSMLNEIGKYLNGIATMEDTNVLVYKLFNEILTNIGIPNDILARELVADFDNFGTTIDTVGENVVVGDYNDSIPDLENLTVTYSSNLRARGVKLEDTAFELVLPYRIQQVVKATMTIDLQDPASPTTMIPTELNIDPLILEKSKWDRLTLDTTVVGDRQNNTYRANSFYWNYNDNKIGNSALFGIYKSDNSITNLINRALILNGRTATELYPQGSPVSFPNIEEPIFNITFVPYITARYRQQKADPNDVGTNTQNAGNQNGKLVSAERYIKNIRGGVERLGTDKITFKKFGTSLADLWELGDYINEDNSLFVLSERTITYNLYDYEVEYVFSKNFNRISQRIQIDKEDRQFDITIGKQQVDRREIYEEYIEMNVNPDTNDSLITPRGLNTFINTFRSTRSVSGGRGTIGTYPNAPVRLGYLRSDDMTDPALTLSTEAILRHVAKVGSGNGLAFSWEFEDIQKAGDSLAEEQYLDDDTLNAIFDFVTATFGTGNPIQTNENVFYTDDNAELDTLEMSMYSSQTFEDEATVSKLPIATIPSNPLIGGHGRVTTEANDSFKLIKDRAETIGMTYQIQVVPHYQYARNLIIGDRAITQNNLIKDLVELEALYIWTSDTEQYANSLDNEFAKGTRQLYDYDVVVNGTGYDGTGYVIQVDPSDIANAKSWGLADFNGRLYLGVNQNGDFDPYNLTISNVYFNPKNKRSGVKYRYDNDPITPAIPPEAPINLAVSNNLKTSFTVTWQDNSVDSDNFEYELIRTSDLVTVDSGTIPIGTLTYNATGLTAGQEYQFKIRTVRLSLTSSYSTINNTTEPPVPVAPTGGNITNIQDTSFTMNWTDNAEYEDGFRIYISDISSSGPFDYYGSVGKNVTSEGISGLTSNNQYWLRVFAYNTSEGQLQESITYAEASATTTAPPPPKTNTPSIISVSSTEDTISFKVRNLDQDNVDIRADYNNSNPSIVIDTNLPYLNDTPTETFRKLIPNTTYTIYATAQASDLSETVSNADSYSIKTQQATPTAPSNLTLTYIDDDGTQGVIQADWTNANDYQDGYIAELHGNASYTDLIEGTNQFTPIYNDWSAETFTFFTLVPVGNTYYVRVRSRVGSNFSSWITASITI